MMIVNEEINTISEEQVLHNKLNFEINKELIHLMKRIVELQQQNKKYKEVIDKLKEWIYIVQQNKDNKHLEPFISTDELDELLDILK